MNRHYKKNIYNFNKPQLANYRDYIQYLKQIDKNRFYSNFGPIYLEATNYINKHLGLKNNCSILTSSGHSSLFAIFLYLKQKQKQKQKYILVPDHSFHSNLQAIISAGFTPIFYRYEPDDQIMQEKYIMNILKKRRNVIAINFVSCHGKPIDIHFLNKIQKKTRLHIIYDAADTFINLNKFLDISKIFIACSFHPTKNIPANETGLIVANKKYKDDFESTINFGIEVKRNRQVKMIGFNGKCSEYDSAILLANLKQKEQIKKKIKSKINFFIKLINKKKFILPADFPKNWISKKFYLVFRITKKNLKLREELKKKGYLFDLWTNRPICQYKLYKKHCKIDKTIAKNNFMKNKIGISLTAYISNKKIKQLADKLNEFENF
jgi:dTDP-4-amino-4,6-dideoxygalactose transaminase